MGSEAIDFEGSSGAEGCMINALLDWFVRHFFHLILVFIVSYLLVVFISDIGNAHDGFVGGWRHVCGIALLVFSVAFPAYFAGRQDGRDS